MTDVEREQAIQHLLKGRRPLDLGEHHSLYEAWQAKWKNMSEDERTREKELLRQIGELHGEGSP